MDNLKTFIEDIDCLNRKGQAGYRKGIPGQMPFTVYNERIEEFIEFFYESDLLDPDYKKNLTFLETDICIDDIIEIKQISTLLTEIIRKERFVEGLLLSKIEDGTILKLLRKYVELSDL